MNPAQYLLTVSMIIAAQAPMRHLHATPVITPIVVRAAPGPAISIESARPLSKRASV